MRNKLVLDKHYKLWYTTVLRIRTTGESMTDLISVHSRIILGNNGGVFDIPVEIDVDPERILDETEQLYRISIGKLNDSVEVPDVYQALFAALDKTIPFIQNINIIVRDEELTLCLAYVTKTIKPYGVFYDIEAEKQDIKYKGNKH